MDVQKKELKKPHKTHDVKGVEKSRGARPAMFVFISFALLLAAAYTLIFFNFFEARNIALAWLSSMDSEYMRLESRWESLNKSTDEVKKREDAVKEEEARQQRSAADLDTREKELVDKERAASENPGVLTIASPEREEQLKKVAIIYGKMESEDAATVLSNITDTRDMLAIISHLSPKKAAEVLNYFDAAQAAWITQNLIK